MSSTRATASGERAANDGVNHRAGAISRIGAIPSARTSAARSSQACLDGIGTTAVQQTTSESIRSGALAASHSPVIPPSDTPQKAADVIPQAFISSSTSVASSATEYGPGGAA